MEQLVRNIFFTGWWIILKYPASSSVLLLNYMSLLKIWFFSCLFHCYREKHCGFAIESCGVSFLGEKKGAVLLCKSECCLKEWDGMCTLWLDCGLTDKEKPAYCTEGQLLLSENDFLGTVEDGGPIQPNSQSVILAHIYRGEIPIATQWDHQQQRVGIAGRGAPQLHLFFQKFETF